MLVLRDAAWLGPPMHFAPQRRSDSELRDEAIADRAAGALPTLWPFLDEHLPKAVAELEAAYPGLEFRAVACNFGPGQSYLDKIAKATADVDVQLVFNNAGFIVTGFFDTQPAGKLLVNVECNATAATSITHHFTALMLQKRLRGCVVFTSSASAYIPNPFAVSYGATKAYMSQFAASIAVELSCKGIDVLVVHPSPVASHFYNKVLSLPLSARRVARARATTASRDGACSCCAAARTT